MSNEGGRVMSRYDASIDRIMDIEIANIVALKKSLNRDTMAEIIDLLLTVKPEGHKVIVAGCGTSGLTAKRIAHSLCVVEVPALYCSPADSIHGGLGVIQKDDVVILFSKGGNTPEILNYIPVCKAKGAKLIGVSQNDDSVLAKHCDIYFKVYTEHESDMFDMCASASCTAMTAVWDSIIFTIMRFNGYTKEDLMLTHSGGKVGELLKEGK